MSKSSDITVDGYTSIRKVTHSVHPHPFLQGKGKGRGGGGVITKFSKGEGEVGGGGLDRTLIFRGVLVGKRGVLTKNLVTFKR